ncbi:ABC transporter substrate-binding protein [Marmoricola endophyticus]|uniref:ABC transporter substrate-binding protein n=1 Tax=Marmoricola endophyticus TaxID=2040280 RepID=A0A917F4V1_9ACTN|nr:iron-siderophore ABC transporter substrate-binding protein [Marmoricola endophyticus]GGF46786.1 ABC transporter substrate-binding protein [Marmoricola endophyticus]
MRRLPLLAVLALVLGLLAGCGSSGSDDSSAGAASGTGFPVTVPNKFGGTTLEEAPERVVALGWGDAETALALGVQPVGASDWLAFGGDGLGPWAEGAYDEKPTIIGTQEPDYEKVAALRPDVILDTKSSGDQDRYERLSSIAPTIAVPKGADNYLISPKQQLSLVARALGRTDQAAKVQTTIDDAFATARKAHPEFAGKSTVAAAYTSEGWGAYVDGSERVGFLERLGFELSPAIKNAKAGDSGFTVRVSAENLDQLDADVLVSFPIYVDPSQISDQAAYQALPVVKRGGAVLIADKTTQSAYSLASPQAQLYAVKSVVPLLAKAVAAQGS